MMARLTLSYGDCWQKVAEYIGWVASGTAPTGQKLTDCKAIVARGLRQFLYPINIETGQPHEWSFLKQYWTHKTTGNQWKIALPLDFSDLLSDPVFDTGTGVLPLKKRSAEQIKDMRAESDQSSDPEFYAIVPTRYNLDTGGSYEMWLYPKPGTSRVFSAFYRIDPLQPSADADIFVGGVSATEAILESCLAVAESSIEDMTTTHHTALAQKFIQTLIKFDSGKTDSDVIGNLYHDRDTYWPRERGPVTIDTDNVYQ
jgi:hypothetical protein